MQFKWTKYGEQLLTDTIYFGFIILAQILIRKAWHKLMLHGTFGFSDQPCPVYSYYNTSLLPYAPL